MKTLYSDGQLSIDGKRYDGTNRTMYLNEYKNEKGLYL